MWTRSLKCSLVVVLFACVFLAGSGSVSAGTHDGADTSALSSTGALQDAEDIPGTHDRHKGIRSYDSTGFPQDNNANRGVKSYGTPSGHGASQDHGIKGGGHGYNKNDDGCSKCKSETDWEQDEPEEEGDENDGDECDDGQYRPNKVHHHGPGHKPGSRPSEVYKTGPTGVYVDDGIQRDSPAGSLGSGVPSSQEPGISAPNFGVTSKPGQGWNNQFPSGPSAIPHIGSSTVSPSNYGNTLANQNRPYGQPGTQNTYANAYAGASATSGIATSYGEPSNFGRKNHPFDLYKPANTRIHGPQSGIDQLPSTGSGYYGLGGYTQPASASHSTQPTTITNTFGTTRGPHQGIDTSRTVPGIQENSFGPGSTPGSPSGSNTWHGTRTTPQAGFPTVNTATAKTPFSHVSIPSPTLSAPYDRTHPKPGFNVASSTATANAGASVFGTSPTYSTPSVIGTTPSHRGSSYTSGVTGSIGSTRPTHGTIPHDTYPNVESATWPGGHPASSRPWSSGKPEDGSGITPGRHSPDGSGILPGQQPQGVRPTWPTGQPASGSGVWPNRQPGDGTWSSQVQPGHWSGLGCPSGNCGGATGPQEGSNCGGCCGNYNCDGCNRRGNIPAHGCSGAGGSKVNKTYYPAGIGDGNVPNIGYRPPVYRPPSHLPGTPGTNVILESPVTWNSANPFLYQPGGGTPSSFSHPWTETTDKPLGLGNPFLNSNWNRPKPEFSNTYNDRNVIPGGDKPIGQGNLFLDGHRRGDANPNEGVIPLGGKIPEGNNPFLRPLVGGSSGSPSYGQPDRPGTPGSFPGSGTPGNYPGSGTPTNYPGSGTPGNYPGSGTPTNYPGSGIPTNYPGSGIPGNYPGSGIPTNYPGSGASGNYPGSGTPTNYPGSGTPENYPGSATPGNYPGSGTSGNYPGSGTPGNYAGSETSGNYPGAGMPGNYPGSGIPGSGGHGGSHSGGVPSQDGNSGRFPPTGNNSQGAGPLECKLGVFGCGTSGSGSYAGNPGAAVGGNVGAGIGNPRGVGPSGSGISHASHPGSEGNNLAASLSGAYARSFSSAQASSFAGSVSGASGPASNFGRNLSPNGAQNQGASNSWTSSGASAFASSSAGSWSGSDPVNVKG